MSFIDIEDPRKADEIVADFIRSRGRIRDDDTRARLGQVEAQNSVLAKSKPIVQSLDKVVDKLSTIRQVRVDPPETLYDEYAKLTINKDHVFGMYKKDENTYWLGNQEVFIDNNENITIGGHNYGNARGLWNLLMLNNPDQFRSTEKDKTDYLDIVGKTDLVNNRLGNRKKDTAKLKWLRERWGDEGGAGLKDTGGYIDELIKHLHLVVAERYAGNVEATTPVIQQILGDLKRIHYLNSEDLVNIYRELCIPLGNLETGAT